MSKIIVDDDFLDKDNKEFINHIILGNNFPLFHKTKIVSVGPESKEYNGFFTHIILNPGDNKWNSKHHPFFESILRSFIEKHKLRYEWLYRAAVNLTYNNGIKDRSPIHVDHSFPHRQLIVYLNDPQDKEAKTFILDKKKKKVLKEITPKQYRGIFFPSLPHYHIMPKFGERMVFVITFK
jgi:hypothetical protein